MASYANGGSSDALPEPRDRSKSFNSEQRPQPKPRKRAARTQSVRYSGNSIRPATSFSADSSPQLSREIKHRSVLQPTPLVLALTNQLMSTLNRNDEEQPEETKSGTQKADDLENGEHSVGNYVTDGTKNLPLHSKIKNSPVIQRKRALSEPRSRIGPPRPPPPAHPPPPNPRLSHLISDYQVPNSAVHVIDSRSKTPPARRPVTTSARKTTKYGTPPPRRPAPPPPNYKGRGIEKTIPQNNPQVTPVPKPRNSPIPKPRSSSLPKPRNLENINQVSASTDKLQQPNSTESSSRTSTEIVDQNFPVYEDLDKDMNNYEKLDPSSSEEEENELTMNTRGDPSANNDTPPALPPKKGSKVKQDKGEELPPALPPRTLPATNVKTHGLLRNHGEVHTGKGKDSERDKEEAIQDTGVYEPVNYQDSDNESHESYTEMNDPSPTFDDDMENDKPEDIYITMDPHAYIPPPESYKPNKKRTNSLKAKH